MESKKSVRKLGKIEEKLKKTVRNLGNEFLSSFS